MMINHITDTMTNRVFDVFYYSRLVYAFIIVSFIIAKQCAWVLAGTPFTVSSWYKMLLGYKKYECITPVLASLHWLPVRFQIDFKILLLTFKALNDVKTNEISR